MFNGQMSFLNMLSIRARHSDHYIGRRAQASAVPGERDCAHTPFSCCLDCPDNVGRISARAYSYEDITGVFESLDLSLEDSFEAAVIAESGQEGWCPVVNAIAGRARRSKKPSEIMLDKLRRRQRRQSAALPPLPQRRSLPLDENAPAITWTSRPGILTRQPLALVRRLISALCNRRVLILRKASAVNAILALPLAPTLGISGADHTFLCSISNIHPS